ncbi:MAG: hypothetical protein AMXMBFR4_13110 [Candidatus Hydrogenedentota bacterium]
MRANASVDSHEVEPTSLQSPIKDKADESRKGWPDGPGIVAIPERLPSCAPGTSFSSAGNLPRIDLHGKGLPCSRPRCAFGAGLRAGRSRIPRG